MTKKPLERVLIVDDDASHLHMLETVLQSWNLKPLAASGGKEALALIEKIKPDYALVDMRMPEMSGIETMRALKKIYPALPVAIMTAYSEVADAVEAMRQGAADYLPKPLDMTRLKKILLGDSPGREKRNAEAARENSGLGSAPALRPVLEVLEAAAPTSATILITGASGTGKEVAAREIHARSRRKGAFVGINCAAISPQLLESELFGHEKGAFTGADKEKSGLFAEARDGTLFLDEIGEMPLPMQAKLLRVLQEREYLRVGGQKPLPFTGRIIAATNRILEAEIAAGRFREDLFYRLNVLHLEMPALKDRAEDIPWLAGKFAEKFAMRDQKICKGIASDAMSLLAAYSWPGNIRELENVIERAVILLAGEYITPKLLPEVILKNRSPATSPQVAGNKPDFSHPGEFKPVTLQEMEKDLIMKTLAACGGNKTETARALGITRKTLHVKLRGYEQK